MSAATQDCDENLGGRSEGTNITTTLNKGEVVGDPDGLSLDLELI